MMPKKSTQLFVMFVGLLALVVGCGSAVEQQETTPPSQPTEETAVVDAKKPSFEEIDVDGDGFLTAEELNAAFFPRVDTDGDGKISAAEWSGPSGAAHTWKSSGHC